MRAPLRNDRGEDSGLRQWLIGLVVLLLWMWGISLLLDPVERTSVAQEDVEASTQVDLVMDGETPGDGVPLAEILPLGSEDVGARIRVSGEVTGQPIDEGYWLLTDEDEVLFVKTDQPAQVGDPVSTTGTLRQAEEGAGEARASAAKLREAIGWKVHRDLFLDIDAAPPEEAGPEVREASTAPDDTAP